MATQLLDRIPPGGQLCRFQYAGATLACGPLAAEDCRRWFGNKAGTVRLERQDAHGSPTYGAEDAHGVIGIRGRPREQLLIAGRHHGTADLGEGPFEPV